MSLRILRLKIDISTANGKYGRDIEFAEKGLTIVRAENTMGKSTLANSILYCLGLDAMLSAKHDIPLTYAIKTKFLDSGEEIQVQKSSIYIQLKNDKGIEFTIKRDVAGENVNHKVISVLTNYSFSQGTFDTKEDFFIRDGGSASREKGFHFWLENFLGWSLPTVTNYDGRETKLYMECIFPLFFIEQKAGWIKIQATVPSNYKIKDPRQKAIEFVLELEKMTHIQKLSRLDDEMNKIESQWSSKREFLKSLELSNSFSVTGVPKTVLSEDDKPLVKFIKVSEGRSTDVNDYLKQLQTEFDSLSDRMTMRDNPKSEASIEDFKVHQDSIRIILSRIEEIEKKREILRIDLRKNQDRLSELTKDTQNFKDLIKLRNMGSTNVGIDFEHCPVCDQDISGNLIHPSRKVKFQSLEENLAFTQAEEKVLESILLRVTRELDDSNARVSNLHKELKEKRSIFEKVRESLFSSKMDEVKNLALRKANTEGKLQDTKNFIRKYNEELNTLVGLQDIYKDKYLEKQKIPKGLSFTDKSKLKVLEENLKHFLQKFDFKSIEDLNELSLSEVTYHPQVNDIDWYFDLSSSDNIRGIWAYTLAIAKLASTFPQVSSGFVVFDEPKQQSAGKESFLKFIDELTVLPGTQTVVFTSEPEDVIKGLAKSDLKVISLGKDERVIKKF